ncbi:MAG: 5-formyltetrahydrofolate cyclo-ligase [Akkermansiaceae bacterium]|nr:5-formyltetrahydrofolate cyclo-ligase [Akkermansiaceae bacterium]
MANPNPSPTKSQLRNSMRQTLRDCLLDFSPACAALDHWLTRHPTCKTIATYSALPGEVDLTLISSQHPNRRWVYPKVAGNHLTFHHASALEPGAFGILEPSAGSREVPLQEIDAFLCPGLAFDLLGNRLGRGLGFYDRLLSQARPDALKIGICFPFQIVSDLFHETHDVKMDQVLY